MRLARLTVLAVVAVALLAAPLTNEAQPTTKVPRIGDLETAPAVSPIAPGQWSLHSVRE